MAVSKVGTGGTEVRARERLPDAGSSVADCFGGASPVSESNKRPQSDRENQGASERQLRLTKASSITAMPVQWTWDDRGGGRIPAGAITLTPGMGGIGKSTFHMWLVAQVTRGCLPGIHKGTPRSCIVCAGEDSWPRTIVPRLQAAGADMDRVFRIEVEKDGKSDRLTLPIDVRALEAVIRQNDVALVSLDPLMTLIGVGLDTHKDHDVRQALEPLVELAEATDVAIIGNAHFNKSQSGNPMSRVTGSAAFGAVVRSVLAIARDDEEEYCVVSLVKSNLGRLDLPHLAYRIEEVTVDTPSGSTPVGRLVWVGASDRGVSELLTTSYQDGNGATDRAKDWLQRQDVLGGKQERLASDLCQLARQEGISERSLQRASHDICDTRHDGFGGKRLWKLQDSVESAESKAATIPAQSRQPIDTGENGESLARTVTGPSNPECSDELDGALNGPREEIDV